MRLAAHEQGNRYQRHPSQPAPPPTITQRSVNLDGRQNVDASVRVLIHIDFSHWTKLHKLLRNIMVVVVNDQHPGKFFPGSANTRSGLCGRDTRSAQVGPTCP